MQNATDKKSLKKQLVVAIIMLLVAALALGTATYAWFVNNNSVEAKGMTVNAVADSSLLIMGKTSSSDTKYSSIGTNGVSVTDMKPSTSFDGVNFGSLTTTGEKAVKVKSAGVSDATWTGTGGAFESDNLLTVASAGTYYVESKYSMKITSDSSTVTSQNVYVSSISAQGTNVGTLDKAIRISVTGPKSGGGTVTYVFNPNGGTNHTDGVGMLSDKGIWSLASKTYDAANDTTKTFAIGKTASDIVVNIWYEGQDSNCYTDAVTTTNAAVTLNFAIAE